MSFGDSSDPNDAYDRGFLQGLLIAHKGYWGHICALLDELIIDLAPPPVANAPGLRIGRLPALSPHLEIFDEEKGQAVQLHRSGFPSLDHGGIDREAKRHNAAHPNG